MFQPIISRDLKLMGVINTTPDSFSDGGCFDTTEKAFAQAQQMIAAGVDILDIGGESTRPASQPVDQNEELARTIPLIKALREISEIHTRTAREPLVVGSVRMIDSSRSKNGRPGHCHQGADA